MNASQGPIAGRLKRPSWKDPRLLIGLVLIATSVVAVCSIVQSADSTVPHYVARDTLAPGTVIDESHLLISHVRVDQGTYVEAGDSEPWGLVVTRVVAEGELVPVAALTPADAFDSRPVAVRSSLPIAEGIDKGALVDVWLTQDTEEGPQSRQVASSLTVDQVDRTTGAFSVGGSETVYVVVPRAMMAEFLDAIASDGEISVVGLASAGNS